MVSFATSLLLLLFTLEAHLTQVAGLQIYYYRQPLPPYPNPIQSWKVEGLATRIVQSAAFSDNLDCNTTSNSGARIGWTGQVGLNPYWVQSLANGKRLVLDSFTNADFGIYTCSDGVTNESLTIIITSVNPAVQAVSNVVTIEAGSSGQLKVYASGIPDPASTNITWFKVGPGGNTTELKEPTVNFSSDHRTLLLSNVQESDGGTYRCSVTISGTTVLSTLHLNVSSKAALNGNPSYQATINYSSGCPPGYSQDGGDTSLCLDVNECQRKNGDCQQLCRNTNGSFVCACWDGFVLNANGFQCQENSTVSSISHQGQVIIPATESILVAVIVLLAASMTIVSLSFAFYCCYVHQQLGKVKTYSVNSPNSIEKYNVEPYLTTAGQSCAAIDPVYSDIK